MKVFSTLLGTSLFVLFVIFDVYGQKDTVKYEIYTDKASEHILGIRMELPITTPSPTVDLRIPNWTPGYYQTLDFGALVQITSITNDAGENLTYEQAGNNTWRVATDQQRALHIRYEIETPRHFVALPYIDSERAFIRPTGVFLYTDEHLQHPTSIRIYPQPHWNNAATGLRKTAENFYFTADNFDILYDSPILVGQLRQLPSFDVGGIPHHFAGHNMVDFDATPFIQDLQKIVEKAVDIFGDIPYEDYTFIGLGEGNGGIEQSNSTAISFTGARLDHADAKIGTLSFIAHEYFHHYNVKRIRPLELGPFDYSGINRTKSLWLSEGLTVYYETQLLHRAGLISPKIALKKWASSIEGHENNPGKTKQTLAQSSYYTWEDGPFGRRGETISYYQKGPIIGMLLDISIRHATENKKSLDDVMKNLYNEYYKRLKRGASEDEIRHVCEQVAGKSLQDIFQYIDSTEPIDYNSYFERAGLRLQLHARGDQSEVELQIQEQLSPLQKAILADLIGLK